MTAQLGDERLPERFWSKVTLTPSGCWQWASGIDRYGYGRYRLGAQMRKAHRVSYTALQGQIEQGLQLDHLCRNRACVNPEHLEPVTQAENARRSAAALKTHCKQGHEFTPENTYRHPGSGGMQRACRTCNREAVRRYTARKKGVSA